MAVGSSTFVHFLKIVHVLRHCFPTILCRNLQNENIFNARRVPVIPFLQRPDSGRHIYPIILALYRFLKLPQTVLVRRRFSCILPR